MLLNVTEKDTRIRTDLEMDARLIKVVGLQNAYMYYVLKEIQRAQDCYCRYYYSPPRNEYGSFSSIPFQFSEYDKEFFAEEMYIQQHFGIPIPLQKMLLYNLNVYGLIHLRIEGFFCKPFVTLDTHIEYYYIHTEHTNVPKERIFEQLDDFTLSDAYIEMTEELAWEEAFNMQEDMFITSEQAAVLNKLNAYRYMYIAIMDNEKYSQPFIDKGVYNVLSGNDNIICAVPIKNLTDEDIKILYAIDERFVHIIFNSLDYEDNITEQSYIAIELSTRNLDKEWEKTDYYKQTYVDGDDE